MTTEAQVSAASDTAARAFPRDWMLVFGALFVCAWSGNQFSPLLVMYREQDHFSASTVTAFLGIYVVGLVPALIVSGSIADRVGRRAPMLVAVIAGLIGSVLLASEGLGLWTIFLGRMFSGVAVGTATAVGTTWLKELSRRPFDPAADASSGARRASLAFTLGSALGALVAGCIAQWGPWTHSLPFLLHIVVTVPFLWLIRRPVETAPALDDDVRDRGGFLVSSARHRRFVRVVMICCPWLFIACGLSYGYQPVLLADAAGGLGLAYGTLLSVIALGTSAAVQPLAKRIDSESSARGLLVSLAILVVGIGVMIAAVTTDSLLVGVVASIVFGVGFGIGLTSGLMEVQRIAPPTELARLTGIFYAVAYIGFAMPTLLAALTPPFTTLELLIALAVLLGVSLGAIGYASEKHLPRRHLPDS
ncbi:MFS transporter [Gordonia liuliyuniae]|uniref:MFS transporter n=1 Tax=Gordonia liuliyuniae TaxID=2911517 RepID=A0ABS9INT9_9ACTN|nr:MFS transporter [Gordonia liuliyuniae]MCF8587235.1 MFS transporter [Gordonia liuliyuniae]